MYDPAIGRFTSPDTIIPIGQGSQAWDRYAYTNNNPIRFSDSSGHCAIFCGIVVAAATVAVSATIMAAPFVVSAMGYGSDSVGALTVMAFTDTNDAIVAAGLTVQSQYPWAIFTGSGRGMAQLKADEMEGLGLEGNDPSSPSVAVKGMAEKINQAYGDCKLCSTGADKLVVAALAQNGFDTSLFNKLTKNDDGTLNWNAFLEKYGNNPSAFDAKIRQKLTGLNYETQLVLKIYMQDLRLLRKLGYDLPEGIDEDDIKFVEDNYLE
jgi:hypothetical protein